MLLAFLNFGSRNEKSKDLGERHGLPLQLTCTHFPKQMPRFSCVSKTSKCTVRINVQLGLPSGSVGKESACSAGDLGSILGSGKSPGEGNDNPLQYSCLGNPMIEDPGGLQPMGSQRIGHNSVTVHRIFSYV